MKLELIDNADRRPVYNLEKTIDILHKHIADCEAIYDYSEVMDILYHLENFKRILDWLDPERELNAKDES